MIVSSVAEFHLMSYHREGLTDATDRLTPRPPTACPVLICPGLPFQFLAGSASSQGEEEDHWHRKTASGEDYPPSKNLKSLPISRELHDGLSDASSRDIESGRPWQD